LESEFIEIGFVFEKLEHFVQRLTIVAVPTAAAAAVEFGRTRRR
jgi:hypothetical protein